MRTSYALKTWSRVDWLLAAAFAALLLGVTTPWCRLPTSTLTAFGTSLWLPTLMRGLPAVGAVVVLGMLRRNHGAARHRLWLWSGLLVSGLFPFLTATFSPAVAYVAAALDLQRDGVAYHIESHFPDVQSQWKHSMHLDPYEEVRPYAAEGFAQGYVDPLQTLPARPFSIDNSEFFQASSWDQFLLEGMNYLPGFLGCVGWGWPVTVAALSLALFAAYLARPAAFFADWARMWRWCLGGLALVLFLIVTPTVVSRQISVWQARGDHRAAARAAHFLYAFYPPVRADVTSLMQMAQSDALLGRADRALVNFAKGVEVWRMNRPDMALTYFAQSLEEDERNFLARGYLAAAHLRLGVQQYEQGQPLAAAASFAKCREVFPNHIQATYCSMIAKAASADYEGSAVAAVQLRELQQYFGLPGIAAIGQSHLHEAWADFRAGRLDQAWQTYRKSVDRGAWE